jgi:hypothetical protein
VLGVSLKTLYNRLKEYAGNKAGGTEASVDQSPATSLLDSCLTTIDAAPPSPLDGGKVSDVVTR